MDGLDFQELMANQDLAENQGLLVIQDFLA